MKRMMMFMCIAVLFAAVTAQAQILVNGDFDLGVGGYISDGGYAPDGWFVTAGSAGGWHQNTPPEVVQGLQSVVVWDSTTILAQLFAFAPETTYDISLDVINSSAPGMVLSVVGDLVMYVQSYDAAWGYLDGVEVARFQSGIDPDNLWTTIGDQYTTPAGAVNGQIYFVFEGAAGTHMSYDNASVTPEPATMALLGLGGLVLRRRKK